MKQWVIKNVTKRDIKDHYRMFIKIADENDVGSVLDVAPPHVHDISNRMKGYKSIGLFGKHIDIKHDLSKSPFPVPDKSYDMVILSNIIEHFKNPFHLLTEAQRIAKKYVLITVPVQSTPVDKKYAHKWKYKMFFTFNRSYGKFLPYFMRKMLSTNMARYITIMIDVGYQKGR